MSVSIYRALVLGACALGPVALAAQEEGPQVGVHLFGDWSYGNTSNRNIYLEGTDEGNYSDAILGINLDARVNTRLNLVTQVTFDAEEHDADLEYVFADWAVSDKLHFRAGQAKQPFGLYSETFSIGTLRPMIELPQAFYGAAGITGRSYKGIGLTGHVEGERWGFDYDIYGGGTDLEEQAPPELVLLGEPFDESNAVENESTRDVVGGRFLVGTPLMGFRFGGAAYTGHEVGSNQRTGFAGSAEYVAGKVQLRAEIGYERVKDDLKATGWYVEGAYQFTPHWQIAGQYDHLTTSLDEQPNPADPSLLDHKEVVGGLNYWFDRNFVIKVNVHHVKGNRFAVPAVADLANAVANGTVQHTTDLVQVAAQFSF